MSPHVTEVALLAAPRHNNHHKMDITDEQKAAITEWARQGEDLSAIQSRLKEELDITLTYVDTRFLLDDAAGGILRAGCRCGAGQCRGGRHRWLSFAGGYWPAFC